MSPRESDGVRIFPEVALENFVFLGLDPNAFDKYFSRGGVYPESHRTLVNESLNMAIVEGRMLCDKKRLEFHVDDLVIAMMYRSSLMRKDFKVISGSGGRGTKYNLSFGGGKDIFPWYEVYIFTNIAGFNKVQRSYEEVKPDNLEWKTFMQRMQVINGYSVNYNEIMGEKAIELNRW